MLQKTRGVVLRAVRYGETSLVVTIFTEQLGIQSYLVNGVRTARPARMKPVFFQPGTILDLVVYHHTGKNLQRISEIQFGYVYRQILADPIKSAVMLYITELLLRLLQHPQVLRELYQFTEQALVWLDQASSRVANLPLYFTLQTAALLGVGLQNNYDVSKPYFDLHEGLFTAQIPAHPDYMGTNEAKLTSQLLNCQNADEAAVIPLTRQQRRKLIGFYQDYLRWHVPGFTALLGLDTLFQLFDPY
ncbi:MAG: DNA repair protein RecO [Thermoflavifilum sp.]|nr:DNA repair protein RecO [Thermoflavifilum sp.]